MHSDHASESGHEREIQPPMVDATRAIEIASAVLNTMLLVEVAGLFLSQYRKSRERLPMLLTICFCSFCGSSIFYFLRFFGNFDVILGEIFYKVEVAMRFASFTTFVYLFEKQGKKRRVPYWTVFCIACIALISLLPYEIAYMLSFTIYIAAIIVFAFFFRVLAGTEGSVRRNILVAIVGAFILGVGIGVSADLLVMYGGDVLIVSGLFLQVVGMIIIGLSFYAIRSADEFSWHPNVQTVYVIHNSICIFAYSVEQDAQLKEGALHGGGIATVLIVSQAVSKSDEPPNHIEFQDLHFVVRVGTRVFDGGRLIAVLQVRKDLVILNEKLDRFVSTFEEKFSGVLEGSRGIVNMAKINAQSEQLTSMFRLKRGS
jgi:hypothetical protein